MRSGNPIIVIYEDDMECDNPQLMTNCIELFQAVWPSAAMQKP